MTKTPAAWKYQHETSEILSTGKPTDGRGLRLRAASGYTHVHMGTADGWLQIAVAIRKVEHAAAIADVLALALPVAAPELRAGDLAVFVDHAGRQIGCRVLQIWAAGVVSTTAQVKVSVAGLSAPEPYRIGMALTLDAAQVKGAF